MTVIHADGPHMIAYARLFALVLAGRIRNERAASLVEYALLVGLIAVVCIVAVSALGKKASSKFNSVQSSL